MATVEELERKIQDQDQQIRTLKQAVTRLERKLRSVSVVANRAQGQAHRTQERVNTLKLKERAK